MPKGCGGGWVKSSLLASHTVVESSCVAAWRSGGRSARTRGRMGGLACRGCRLTVGPAGANARVKHVAVAGRSIMHAALRSALAKGVRLGDRVDACFGPNGPKAYSQLQLQLPIRRGGKAMRRSWQLNNDHQIAISRPCRSSQLACLCSVLRTLLEVRPMQS